MGYIVLAGAVLAAAVIGVDLVRQRRMDRHRIDVERLIRARLATAAGASQAEAALRLRRDASAPTTERAEPAGIWAALADQLDIEQFRPKLADATEIVMFEIRWGNDYAMISSPDGKRHYQLELWEADLVRRMDGSRTVGELVVERFGDSGDLDAAGVIGLVESLRLAGMFDPAPIDASALVANGLDPASGARRKLQGFAKELKVSWVGADAFVRTAYEGGLKQLFRPVPLAFATTLAVAGLIAFISVLLSHRFELTLGNPPVQTAILLGLGFALTFAHEMGHALALVHYGRKIGSSGFLIYYGSLAFYVDASDGLMLNSGKRIVQAAAGPFAEVALAGVSSLLLFAFPSWTIAPFLYKFSFLNYYVIALNLIPLLELDGYWILSDAIQVEDLRPRSLAFIQRDLWRKLRRRERFTPQEGGLALYGVLGLTFTIFTLAVGLVFWKITFGTLLTDLWRMGLWTRVLLVLLVLFLAGPAIRGLISAWRALVRRVGAVVRRIRFRVETSWRVEAAELIDGLPAFEDLSVGVLNDLAGRVRLRTVPRGQAVFHRGDRADAFYVLRRGRAVVEDEHPETGDTRVLTTLSRGESFGELGLLERAARTATVRAVDDVELFEIDRPTFDRLLADPISAPDFGPTMHAHGELNALPPFRTLTFSELADLLAHGSWITVAPGELLLEQGAPGDAFYVIGSGQADVVKDGEVVATLGAGDHFGEIALLEEVPRTASVRAATRARVFRLDRDGFDALVADSFRRGTLRRASDRTWEH
jgi:CRP-like cAMP-binding protein/Zn-dependent protease